MLCVVRVEDDVEKPCGFRYECVPDIVLLGDGGIRLLWLNEAVLLGLNESSIRVDAFESIEYL